MLARSSREHGNSGTHYNGSRGFVERPGMTVTGYFRPSSCAAWGAVM